MTYVKEPIKPYPPIKPTVPSRTRKKWVKETIDDSSSTLSVKKIRTMIEDGKLTDDDVINVRMGVVYYDGETPEIEEFFVTREIEEDVSEKEYAKNMKKYQNQLEAYKQLMSEYVVASSQYEKDFKTWSEYKKVRDLEEKKREKIRLEKRLIKLDKELSEAK